MAARRRRSVRAALVLVLGVVLAGAACTTSTTPPTADKVRSTTSATTTTTSPFGVLKPIDAMIVGDCFDLLPAAKQQPYAVLMIPCTELHTYEVFLVAKYAAPRPPAPGVAFPGDLIVSNNADEQCVGGFQAFIGIEWAASHYEIQSWWPTQESWSAKNDRNIVCAVAKVDRAHTKGTAKGIND